MENVILIHGGVGSDRSLSPDLDKICAGINLRRSPLEAVVEAVAAMEDDRRFNAGTGSYPRIDGSIQMDAGVMYQGNFGSVIGLERTRNPIKVALSVMQDSPHNVLSGDGAIAFARSKGFEDYDPGTPETRAKWEKMMDQLRSGALEDNPKTMQFIRKVNINSILKYDTVGAVARIDGKFAAAVSTGGSWPMLRGRVGDVPIIGSGFYAGENGAVVATGIGEEIMKRILCFRVYNRIGNDPLQQILKEEIDYFGDVTVGLIAVTEDEYGSYANKQMATGILKSEINI